ncbi:MAG: AAA family ATPase [Agathobacter sp.]|nr:AAA family ATPase [Agathobacter sp.]
MKHIKYNLVIILSVVLIFLPFVCVVGGLILYRTYQQEWILIVGAIVSAASLFALKGVREWRVKTRREVEYDEFGLSKSKGHYEYLSKAERDQMDLQKTADMERLLNTTAIKKMTKQGPKDPVKELNDMIGLEPVKEAVMEMVARMQFETEEKKRNKQKKGKSAPQPSARHMIFYGPPGSGKTTVARIMTSFLHQYGYIKENKCIEVDGNFLMAGSESALKTELIIRQAYGGVLFVDEAYALTEGVGGDQAIATLIKQMEDNRDKFILILAGYTNEMKALLDTNPGFESRIKDYLSFPDYNDDEMREIFAFMAKKENFTVDDSLWPLYDEMVRRERRSASFGNARTARNILDKVIDRHSLNVAMKKHIPENRYMLTDIDMKNLKLGAIGSASEFDGSAMFTTVSSGGSSGGVIDKNEIAAHTHEGVRDYETALANIIGMDNVKEQIARMQARMRYEKEVGGLGTDINGNHMCFYGPAGTGKTTIARIMTGILFDAGYIKDNKCIEISGQFLKGQYIGHAGKRTEAVVAAAMGGVLFIDEAYLLNDNGSKSGYGSEAVGVLIKAMEDYKSNFVVILAGYKQDIENLLDTNEGFKSRIKNKLYFDNYDVDTLMKIFFKMLGDKYQITKEAAWKVMKVLSAESQKPGFGNGREVRNMIDKIMDIHAYNYQRGLIDINNPRLIIVDDIPDSL